VFTTAILSTFGAILIGVPTPAPHVNLDPPIATGAIVTAVCADHDLVWTASFLSWDAHLTLSATADGPMYLVNGVLLPNLLSVTVVDGPMPDAHGNDGYWSFSGNIANPANVAFVSGSFTATDHDGGTATDYFSVPVGKC
jgi:hypothetical protein